MIINNHDTSKGVYIIAELSANHNNDLDLAIRTIRAMAESGANAVKVQTFTANSMTLDLNTALFKTREDSAWAGQKLFDLYKKGTLPYEWHLPLIEEAQRLGLDFFSSPFDTEAVDFLEDLGVGVYKVASLEINHIPLLQHIASKGKPTIISTGVALEEDIKLALNALSSLGTHRMGLLKCTTAYPTLAEESDLNHIPWLAKRFEVTIGLSDHSMSPTIPAVAVAKGARIIEKHFILDRSLGGVDSHFSLEPNEFKEMVGAVRETEKALGSEFYKLSASGASARRSMRSIFITKTIAAGEIITADHIGILRPGAGLHPKYFDEVVGKKTRTTLRPGHPLKLDDLNS